MSPGETEATTVRSTDSDADASAESHVASLVAWLLLSAVYLISALAIPLGEPARPGGGFFPTVVGVVGVAAAVAALIQEWRHRRHVSRPSRDSTSSGWRRRTVQVAAFVGVMALYIVVAPLIGQTLASALVLVALLRLTRPRPWWQILLFAVVFSVAVTLLFENVLGMRLPAGRVINIL